MKSSISLSLAALALLTACATQWTRPGAAPDEVAADLAACEARALEAFPVLMTAKAPDYRSQSSISCSGTPGTEACRAKPGAYTQEAPKDVNKSARLRAVDECMEAAGYVQR